MTIREIVRKRFPHPRDIDENSVDHIHARRAEPQIEALIADLEAWHEEEQFQQMADETQAEAKWDV